MTQIIDFAARRQAAPPAADQTIAGIDAACSQIAAAYMALEAEVGPFVALLMLMSFVGTMADGLGSGSKGTAQ